SFVIHTFLTSPFIFLLYVMILTPLISTLFPYTTLFRSPLPRPAHRPLRHPPGQNAPVGHGRVDDRHGHRRAHRARGVRRGRLGGRLSRGRQAPESRSPGARAAAI